MNKQDGFYFIPQQWLGDSNVLAMDWDCKGMHLHLMAIAWQQEKKGYLLNDDNLIRKILNNPPLEDWNERIKPQIFKAWKKKVIKENGYDNLYWYQQGILKTLQLDEKTENLNTKKTTISKRKKTQDILSDENIPNYLGFDLKNLLKVKATSTILYKKTLNASKEEVDNIWTLGIQLLSRQNDDNARARGFLAKLIKKYGEQSVSFCIGQLSIKSIKPADINSYLVGMLEKKLADEPIKRTGRGNVSI